MPGPFTEQPHRIPLCNSNNNRAKPGTAMVNHPEPPLTELTWTVAAARLILGPDISIQAPPNLTPQGAGQDEEAAWGALIDSGINDWGEIVDEIVDEMGVGRTGYRARLRAIATLCGCVASGARDSMQTAP